MAGRKKLLTDEEIEDIKRRYAAGETALNLSFEYDVSYSTITKLGRGLRQKEVYKKKCVVCNTEYETTSEQRIYCSKECQAKVYNAKRKSRRINTTYTDFTECKLCGKKFPSQKRRIICDECAQGAARGEKKAIEKQCKVCGITIVSFFDACKDCRQFEKPQSMKTISMVVKEARLHNMSYGEYVASKRKC